MEKKDKLKSSNSNDEIEIKDTGGHTLYRGRERRMNNNYNGNSKQITFWLLGALLAFLLMFIKQSMADNSKLVNDVNVVTQQNSNRISVVETLYVGIQKDLVRMENKIDYLISVSQTHTKSFKNFNE